MKTLRFLAAITVIAIIGIPFLCLGAVLFLFAWAFADEPKYPNR